MLPEITSLNLDTEENKKVARIKLTNISNYIEILKGELPEESTIGIITSDIDNLSAIVLDHIDDKEYIDKSYAEIFRLISNINMQLEQIAFRVA